MEILDWLNRQRETSADFHAKMGQLWRRYGEPKLLNTPLAYAAFEFRCAIERLAFELLFLIREKCLNANDIKRCQNFGKLIGFIKELEGPSIELYRKMKFAQIFAIVNQIPHQIAILDLKKLQKNWSDLSTYCHRQLKPGSTWDSPGQNWIKQGYQFLNKVEDYLWENMATKTIGWISVSTLPTEMVELRKEYIADKINGQQVKIRMELMTPVLTLRRIKKSPLIIGGTLLLDG